MKRMLILFALLGFGIGESSATSSATSEGQVAVGITASFGDVGFFYNSLRPYGEWIEFEAGFYAWRPMHLRRGWRPYMFGRWAWTDYGWYWVSSEPFGWAVYHYGRWYYDDYYGWIWVPDRVWGPAWVEWRYNNDYIGWAPLPPYASFSVGIGIRFTSHWTAPFHYWNFVRCRSFASPYVYRYVVTPDYSRRLIGTTRSAGRYEVNGGRIINSGVDRQFIERHGYTRIDRVNIRESGNRGDRIVRDGTRGYTIEMYRPSRTELERSSGRIDARRPDRGTSLDLQRIDRVRGGTTAPPNRGDANRRSGVERTDPVPRTAPARNEAPNVDRQRNQVRPVPSRREMTRPKTAPPQRREVAPSRTRTDTPRVAPRTKKESPRRSEPARRDGGRRHG